MTPERTDLLGTVLTVVALAAGLRSRWSARLGWRRKRRAARDRSPARRWVPPALLALVAVAAGLALGYQFVARSRAPQPPPTAPPELTHTAEWREWRTEIHRRLSADPLTEEAVADAMRVPLPPLPEPHTEADRLRRDQAVADVLLSYDGVRKMLTRRFGIRDSFLGTGLSKPLGVGSYGSASVHEYLIDNHPDTHDHVWVWILDARGRDLSQPVKAFLAGATDRVPPLNDNKPGSRFADDLNEITQRVRNPDHPLPPMIRFGRFDRKYYKGTVGRPEASHAFTSNLSEVWDLTLQQAAEKSGYYYRDGGDTLFVWVFVPYQSTEFTPATWRHVLERLPEWLRTQP